LPLAPILASLRSPRLGDIFIEDKRGHYRSGTTEETVEERPFSARLIDFLTALG
jgi:hypothetical protein